MNPSSARHADPLELLRLAVATAQEAAELVARGRATAAEHVDVKSSPVDVVAPFGSGFWLVKCPPIM